MHQNFQMICARWQGGVVFSSILFLFYENGNYIGFQSKILTVDTNCCAVREMKSSKEVGRWLASFAMKMARSDGFRYWSWSNQQLFDESNGLLTFDGNVEFNYVSPLRRTASSMVDILVSTAKRQIVIKMITILTTTRRALGS